MAHFAELDESSTVLRVIVVNNSDILDSEGNESEEIGIDFCKSLYGNDTRWVQTSYSGAFRSCFAGFGYIYDPIENKFNPPVVEEPTND